MKKEKKVIHRRQLDDRGKGKQRHSPGIPQRLCATLFRQSEQLGRFELNGEMQCQYRVISPNKTGSVVGGQEKDWGLMQGTRAVGQRDGRRLEEWRLHSCPK